MRAVGLDEVALRRVARLGGAAHEGDAFAIERPRGITVAIYAGRKVADTFCCDVIDGDEAVISAAGNEGQA